MRLHFLVMWQSYASPVYRLSFILLISHTLSPLWLRGKIMLSGRNLWGQLLLSAGESLELQSRNWETALLSCAAASSSFVLYGAVW